MKLSTKILTFLKHPYFILIKLDNIGIIRLKDETYLKLIYKKIVNKNLNLNDPRIFNEKLQWLKLHDRQVIYSNMVDKWKVKDYVAEKIGKEYIIPTLHVYEKFEDISLDQLPDRFVLKCTHDSGGVVIVKNKKNWDEVAAKKVLNKSLKKNFFYLAREWPYKKVVPRIIAETYIEDQEGQDLMDYKIHCFNGIPKYIQVDFNRFTDHHRNIYDDKWNFIDLEIKFPCDKKKIIKRPQKLEEMLSIAKKLSEGIPYLRVDLYYTNTHIYFGELTFYHGGGYETFYPEKYNKIWGDFLDIEKVKIEEKKKK